MKKMFLFILGVVLGHSLAFSQGCLPEGISFQSQVQIDSFQINYPGCAVIEGDVKINGVINLNGLNVLTSIGGNLEIGGVFFWGPPNPFLTSLTGLDNLTSIGGELIIYNNPVLTSLIGLDGITSIGGGIFIHNNGSLTSCAAQSICDYLTSPNGVVDIFENGPGCNSQSEVVAECGGSISCLPYGNYYFLSQTDIDNFQLNFPGCTELNGNFIISGDSVNNLAGFNQVVSVGGNAGIINCNGITSLSGLNKLSNIGGDLYLLHIESLINLSGIENLNTIGGSLGLYENNQLLSLEGLENLDSVGGCLNIGTIYNAGTEEIPPGGNYLLINLNPLESLTYVGSIDIGRNHSLSSIAGLKNINANTVTDLLIGHNPSLSSCDVQTVCDYLSSPNGTVSIHDNASGCNSQEEVKAACHIGLVDLTTNQELTIFPNPSPGQFTFEFSLQQQSRVNLVVLNSLGQVVAKVVDGVLTPSLHQLYWNAGDLPAGIYSLQLKTENQVITKRIIKQ